MVIFKKEWSKLYYTQHTFLNNVRQFVGCLTVWFQPTCIVKVHSWACSKSLQSKFFPFIEKWPKHEEVSLLLMRSVPKSTAISLASDLGVWDTLKLTEQKRRKAKAIRPCCELKQNKELKHTEQFGHIVCEFQREQNTEKRELQLDVRSEEIERNTMRVWESEKEKWDFFLCSSYT